MGIRSALFALGVLVCIIAAPIMPVAGVVGYIGHYSVGPETQWWARPVNALGIRYSFTFAILTAVGLAMTWKRQRFGQSVLVRQEKLLLVFLAVVWVSWLVSSETVGRYTTIDHPAVKFTKVVIFTLMLSHIATERRKIDYVFWAIVVGALALGLEAWETPSSAYANGRLESVGGPDFREANRLGGYLAAMLFLIGTQFVRSRWVGRAVCLIAGGLCINGVIQTDSRGALLAVFGGSMAAVALSPKRFRVPIVAALAVVMVWGYSRTGESWRQRMGTITSSQAERDSSAQTRIEIWAGTWKMLQDHPLGVGVGNFNQSIGRYAPKHPGRSAHSTYFECAGELGWPGLIALAALIVNAILSLRKVRREAADLPHRQKVDLTWMSFGVAVCLAALLTYGLTGALLYMEGLWWVLILPVCLVRAVENAKADARVAVAEESKQRARSALAKAPAV